MPDQGPQTIAMNGLAGVTLVSDSNQEDSGALVPRNLEATQTGIDAGIFLSKTPLGAVIEAATANSVYRIVHVAPNTPGPPANYRHRSHRRSEVKDGVVDSHHWKTLRAHWQAWKCWFGSSAATARSSPKMP